MLFTGVDCVFVQSLYNMLFSAFPVLVFAGLDRDIEARHVLALPELYSTGQFRVLPLPPAATAAALAQMLGAHARTVPAASVLDVYAPRLCTRK